MASEIRCPSCKTKLNATDFQCPRCELILGDLGKPSGPATKGSVVRAMLEKPQARPTPAGAPPPPGKVVKVDDELAEVATREWNGPPVLKEVPRVIATLTLRSMALTPFEAWVVSMIDGTTACSELIN